MNKKLKTEPEKEPEKESEKESEKENSEKENSEKEVDSDFYDWDITFKRVAVKGFLCSDRKPGVINENKTLTISLPKDQKILNLPHKIEYTIPYLIHRLYPDFNYSDRNPPVYQNEYEYQEYYIEIKEMKKKGPSSKFEATLLSVILSPNFSGRINQKRSMYGDYFIINGEHVKRKSGDSHDMF